MSASSATKPEPGKKGGRARTLSLSDVRCNVGNCNYSAKTHKTVDNHRFKIHGIAPNTSFMDQSVSASLILTQGKLADGSLEHSTSAEIYGDMSKAKQSTQIVTPDTSVASEPADRRRKRSSETEDEEDKRMRMGADFDNESQSQGTIERQLLITEAMAAAKAHDNPDDSRSLLEQSETFKSGSENFQNAGNETMLTARSEMTTHEVDSLNYTNGLDRQAEEVKKLESDLKQRTDSLKDSLAKNAAKKLLKEKAKKRKEEKEAKKEKEKEEEAKKEKEEEKAKKKKEKAKQKRKRKRELKKAGDKADSSAMEVDHDTAKDDSTSKSTPAPKKAKTAPKKPTPTNPPSKASNNANAKAPSAEGAETGQTHTQTSSSDTSHVPPTTVKILSHFQIPPPGSQIFTPHLLNANQYQYQTNIPSSFNFSNTLILPQPPTNLPPGGQATGLGTLGGENPWLVPNQTQLGIEMMMAQATVRAQTLNREARLNHLRSELANVWAQLLETSSETPGSEDISAIVTLEQNLKDKLIEITHS